MAITKYNAIDRLINWDTITPQERTLYVRSLVGHRQSFGSIAKATGRTYEEIRAAYSAIEPPYAPQSEIGHTTSVLDDCGHSDGYKGLIAPTCAGGEGCKKCWSIYEVVHNIEGSMDKKVVSEVAPIKNVYSLTYDEIMTKYREWIGWDTYVATPGPEPTISIDEDPYLHGLIISDIHAPFHDENRFQKMIDDNKGKVDIVILAGDGADFHNYSKYMKYGQHFTVKDEHKGFMAVLGALSAAFPKIILMNGNHDERTRKKYAQLLPADLYQALLDFHGSNAFDFSELMAAQFPNIVIPTTPKHGFAEYRFLYQINDIIIGHPELFSKIANKSVAGFIDWLKKKAEPMGLVGPFQHVVMGHTHMAGKTWNDYGITGIENGCLCMTPDYDAGAKLNGVPRPLTRGYTRFKTGPDGHTNPNDINFVEIV